MPDALAWILLGALIADTFTVTAVRPWRRDDHGPVLGLAVGGAGLAVVAVIGAALPDPIPLIVWWMLLVPVAAVASMASVGSALIVVLHAGEFHRDLRRAPVRIGTSCLLILAAALVVIAIIVAPLTGTRPSLAATAGAFLLAHLLWVAGYLLSRAREAR